MDVFAKVLLDRFIAYLMKHPELLDELIEALIAAITKAVKQSN